MVFNAFRCRIIGGGSARQLKEVSNFLSKRLTLTELRIRNFAKVMFFVTFCFHLKKLYLCQRPTLNDSRKLSNFFSINFECKGCQ